MQYAVPVEQQDGVLIGATAVEQDAVSDVELVVVQVAEQDAVPVAK